VADRPSRADVLASYRIGVDAYEKLWGPVILPGAEAVVPWLDLRDGETLLDVGGGTGALIDAIRSAAPSVETIVVDASLEMLDVAGHRRKLPALLADAMAFPVSSSRVDAVVLAYVLFHLSDPLVALMEAARVLRPGGRVATVTWASETPSEADVLWSNALFEAGVPTLRLRRVDTGLDSTKAIESVLTEAGFSPRRAWAEQLTHRWNKDSFLALVTGSGVNRQRLELIPRDARESLLSRFRGQLEGLEPEAFVWEGEVICAVAGRD
jgi:SAM-dependent methyltransferase